MADDTVTKPSAGRDTYWGFLKAFFRDRKTIGAVAPTSKGVARRMAELAGVGAGRAVAEFGPGTGAITRELLAAMPSDSQLWAFEVYAPFVTQLRKTFDDPRLTVLAEPAEAVANVRDNEVHEGFDAIVSSIPFSLIGPAKTVEILGVVDRVLRPGGAFVALQYHPRFLPPFIRQEFGNLDREVYLWNIPPATLLRARTRTDSRTD